VVRWGEMRKPKKPARRDDYRLKSSPAALVGRVTAKDKAAAIAAAIELRRTGAAPEAPARAPPSGMTER